MLGGFTTEQGTARLFAPLSDTLNDAGDMLWNDLADSDVVLQEQRLCATHNEIIHTHGHQIAADRIVFVHRLSDRQFGAHSIRRSS